jgi:hypothetical protein
MDAYQNMLFQNLIKNPHLHGRHPLLIQPIVPAQVQFLLVSILSDFAVKLYGQLVNLILVRKCLRKSPLHLNQSAIFQTVFNHSVTLVGFNQKTIYRPNEKR